MRNVEPFGYFKAEPFGWTDCNEFDPDAQPLWDDAAMCAVEKQRDELLAALIALRKRHQIDDPHHAYLCEFCKQADCAIKNANKEIANDHP